MKLLWALILTSFQAAHCSVACLNDRKDSCNLCPRFYDTSENGGIKLDFNRCAGDCQTEGTGISEECVPKAVNCGQKRETDCSRCPPPGNEDGTDMTLCQGDCQVRTIHNATCVLKDEMVTTTNTTQEQDTTIGSYPNHPASIDLQTTGGEPNVLLTVVKMNIRNTAGINWTRRTPKIDFYAKICVGLRCCETGVVSNRGGIFTFSEDFQNLGTCGGFVRHPDEAVQVTAKKNGRETQQSPLRVQSITVQFDDASRVRAEDVRVSYWPGETTRHPLQWGASTNTLEQEVQQSNNLPEPHCPEARTPTANSCPKENVRVHERLSDESKFCYYQVCRTFTADLSTVQTEQLGSGGYCVPKRQRYPQYKYCCDLEQYFTLPDENETPRQEINFPRCHSMNTTRNDI